ncbi:MAG: DnaK suppressor protein [Candidatus Parcubacteria bacterium]|nr:MAG: DnaK suppressor protein [Candidatus Parcubacteria bacterium]
MNLEKIKNRLEKEREELVLIIESYKKEPEEFLKESVSSADEIADRYEYKQEIHLKKEALEERLKEIERALRKIEEGNYGICENCGQKIEDQRLKIDLSAILCRKCALK